MAAERRPRLGGGRRLGRSLLCLLAAGWVAQAGHGAAADASEAALKAAYLYNFATFTEWPALPAAFEFCVLGQDDIGEALDAIARKEISGRPIHIRRLPGSDVPAECNLVFVAASEKARTGKLLASLATRPVVTVTDIGIDGDAKSLLQLSVEQGKLGFSANLSAARGVGLGFSSRMLRIARSVR